MEIPQPSPASHLPYYSSQHDFTTDLTLDLAHKLTLHPPRVEDSSHEEQAEGTVTRGGAPEDDEEEYGGDDNFNDDDFSFCCGRPDGSPVSAEDVFVDGRIHPVFPLFNQSLLLDGEPPKPTFPLQPHLRRLFAEDGGERPRVVEEIGMPSPGSCKKSNSTGSSKLCRFVDSVVMRSSSDGKDAFVFLRKKDKAVVVASNTMVEGKDKGKGKGKGKGEGGRKPPPSAAAKHRSYLPYRRELLGFFTNSNLLSKNVHPF